VNLPVRWDAGLVLGIALNGYDYDAERAARRRSRTSPSSRRIRWPCAPSAAWLGGRLVRPDERMSGNRIEWQYALHRRALRGAARSASRVRLGPGLPVSTRPRPWAATRTAAASAVILACAWPCALFYSAVYTEGLFFLGVVARGITCASASGRPPSPGASSRAWPGPTGSSVSAAARAAGRRRLAAIWRGDRSRAATRCSVSRPSAGPGIGVLIFSATSTA
jgi:hypothetical protein